MPRSARGRALLWLTALGLLTAIGVALAWALRDREQEVTAELPSAQPPRPAGDWPMYRHDPALTASSSVRGGLGEAPRVAWSLNLGGPRIPAETILVRDVTTLVNSSRTGTSEDRTA